MIFPVYFSKFFNFVRKRFVIIVFSFMILIGMSLAQRNSSNDNALTSQTQNTLSNLTPKNSVQVPDVIVSSTHHTSPTHATASPMITISKDTIKTQGVANL